MNHVASDISVNTFTSSSNQQLVATIPEQIKGHMISTHEWNSIKSGIKKLRVKRKFISSFSWKDLGMVFIGISISMLLSTFLDNSSFTKNENIVIVFSIFIGIVLIIIQYQLEDKNTASIDHVIEVMKLTEKNRFDGTNDDW